MKKVIKRCLYRDGLCSRRNGFGRWWHHKVVVQNGIQAFAKFKNAVHCISENFNLRNFPAERSMLPKLARNCAVLMGAIALILPLYTISLGPSITKSSVRLKFNTNGPVNVFEICPKSVIFTNIKKSESSNCFHRLLIFLSNNQASGSCQRF